MSTTQPTPEPCKKNDPVFLTDTPAPTPRTDDGPNPEMVISDQRFQIGFLQRELGSAHAALAAKDAEIARRKAQLDMWTSAAMDGNAVIAQLTARAEKAEAKLRCADDVLTRNGIPVGSTPGDELVINLIKLFSERDQLRAGVERLKQDNHNIQDNYGIAQRTVDKLRAERAAVADARKAQP